MSNFYQIMTGRLRTTGDIFQLNLANRIDQQYPIWLAGKVQYYPGVGISNMHQAYTLPSLAEFFCQILMGIEYYTGIDTRHYRSIVNMDTDYELWLHLFDKHVLHFMCQSMPSWEQLCPE